MADTFANINTEPQAGNIFSNVNVAGGNAPQPQMSSPVQQPQQNQSSGNPIGNIFSGIGSAVHNLGQDNIPVVSGLEQGAESIVKSLPFAPGYIKATAQDAGSALAAAGANLITAGGSIGGAIENGIASALHMTIPDRWNLTLQSQAFQSMNDQIMAKQGVTAQKAWATGNFLGSLLPYALAAEASGLTLGAKILTPTAEAFVPAAAKFVPAISNAISFLGIGQIEHNPQDGTRVDQLKNDLTLLALFEGTGIAAGKLSAATKSLVSSTVDESAAKFKSGDPVSIDQMEGKVQQAKDAIKQDTGKTAEEVAVKEMVDTKGELPVKDARIAQSTAQPTVVTRNAANLVTHETAPDTQTIAQYKQAIDSGARPPLLVVKEGDNWAVEDGKHKLEAYKQAGITEVPTIEKLSPQLQQIADIKSMETPDDSTLNPILDEVGRQVNDTINPHGQEDNTVQADLSTQAQGEPTQEPTTERQTNQAPQLSNEPVKQNSQQPETAQLPSKGQQNLGSDQGVSRQPTGSKSTSTKSGQSVTSRNPGNESIVSSNTPRNGETLKASKIAKEIEAKAVESKITDKFSQLAGYEPITIKEQARQATNLVNNHFDDAQAIVRGEKPLPEGLKGTSLITAMEEHLAKNPDPQALVDLAKSRLVTGTSQAAQELRLAAERDPYSPISVIKQLEDNSKAIIQERYGESVDKVTQKEVTKIQDSFRKNASNKYDVVKFIKELQC